MSFNLGTGAVIAVLCVIVFMALRSTIRNFRNEIKGGGCSACGDSGTCPHCAKTGASVCHCSENEHKTGAPA
ncbi:MAG: hypothetical protein ACI4OA_03180 [Selenomonadaceae bacterium]